MIRTEATGYGVVYFAENMLNEKNEEIKGKVCLVSGSGNVAQYTIDKLLQLGAKVITFSDSSGYIYDEEGITMEKLDFIKELKNVKRGRVQEYTTHYKNSVFTPIDNDLKYNPLWDHKADCAFPCATQNEINHFDASHICKNGVSLVVEGANMPLTIDAIDVIMDHGIAYAPGKASNAGGVATSGLEMIQNRMGMYWEASEVDARLKQIMKGIHQNCLQASEKYGMKGNYMAGANIAGFTKVAEAMLAQGVV